MNFSREDLIPIKSATSVVPLQQDGRPIHPSTVARWALYGLGGVVLPSIKLAGRRYVRRADLQQFLERCSGR